MSAAGDSGGSGADAPSGPQSGDSGVDATLPNPGVDAAAGEDGSALEDGGSEDAAASCTDGSPVFLDGADDGSGCDLFWHLSCGLPPDAATENCYLLLATCATICGHNVNCRVAECADAGAGEAGIAQTIGPVDIECGTFKIGCGGVGRRPAGLEEASGRCGSDVAGTWLAEAAHLEAASVHAFEQLARDLEALGAPEALVRSARRSAREEHRHARVMTGFAKRRRATPAGTSVRTARGTRSLFAVALENAVEGCVRETFGAVVATRQALRSSDPRFARAMAQIARDETRHAALAWRVSAWAEKRLTAAERRQIEAAKGAALVALRCELARTPEYPEDLGLPRAAEAAALLEAFLAELRRGALATRPAPAPLSST